MMEQPHAATPFHPNPVTWSSPCQRGHEASQGSQGYAPRHRARAIDAAGPAGRNRLAPERMVKLAGSPTAKVTPPCGDRRDISAASSSPHHQARAIASWRRLPSFRRSTLDVYITTDSAHGVSTAGRSQNGRSCDERPRCPSEDWPALSELRRIGSFQNVPPGCEAGQAGPAIPMRSVSEGNLGRMKPP